MTRCEERLSLSSDSDVTCDRDRGHEGPHRAGSYQWPQVCTPKIKTICYEHDNYGYCPDCAWRGDG